MSAVQAVASGEGTKAALKAGSSVIQGRCVLVRRAGEQFIHLVVMPAPDPYSSPLTVEVLAPKRCSDRDADVRWLVRIGGYRRSYKQTDRETGEISTVQTADNKLFFVEEY